MPVITANSISIYYEIHGEGEPLILISGMGGDCTFWNPSLEPLSKCYQVIIFDTRGIGKTDAPTAPYSMEMFADDLAGLMGRLQIEKAHILGFSMGGNIAQFFAACYPEKVLKLILAATFPVMNTQARLFLDAVLSVFENGATTKQMFDLIAPWLFSVSFLSNPEHAAFLSFDENETDQQPFYAWKNQYAAQRNANALPLLNSINCPVLIISGDQDRLAHAEDGALLASTLSNSRFTIIKDSGHLINFEQPELFHQCIFDFLEVV